MALVYDNEYTSIIDIYFCETFSTFNPRALVLQNILDTLSDVLDKCLRFSLIKIEPVSINPSQATLGVFLSSVVYTFLLKMLSLVLIEN
jgi:hypothetical protein